MKDFVCTENFLDYETERCYYKIRWGQVKRKKDAKKLLLTLTLTGFVRLFAKSAPGGCVFMLI